MVSNVQKTPLLTSLNSFASLRALRKTQQLGQSLPCSVTAVSGAIVTVKFEVTDSVQTLPPVTVPVATSRYVREPIQVGDRGYVEAADAYLGGMSGLGGGVADLTLRANLTALVFQPLGSKSWGPSADPDAVVIGEEAPNGVRLQAKTGDALITLMPDEIVLSCGGHTIVINSTGVIIDGRVFLLHEHTAVQTGGDVSGPPV